MHLLLSVLSPSGHILTRASAADTPNSRFLSSTTRPRPPPSRPEHPDARNRECFLAAAREGDWRAADALITRVYGKPQEKLEMSRPDEFDLTKLILEKLQEMKNRILSEHPELAEFTGRAMPSPLSR
jgi:hypothetical protein